VSSIVIVFVLPVAEQHFRLEQRVELLTVQELVTKTCVALFGSTSFCQG